VTGIRFRFTELLQRANPNTKLVSVAVTIYTYLEMLSSNLSQVTGYPDCNFSMVLLSSSTKIPR
jgi:hypothetical protein